MQGAAVQAADEPLRPERGQRGADLRDRNQGAVADRPRKAHQPSITHFISQRSKQFFTCDECGFTVWRGVVWQYLTHVLSDTRPE